MTGPLVVPRGVRSELGRSPIIWEIPSHEPRRHWAQRVQWTSYWLDPDLDLFVIFLSNRLHPDGKGEYVGMAGKTAKLRRFDPR